MEHLRILGSGNGEVQEMEEGTILKKRRGEEYILEMRSDIHGNQYQKHRKKRK